MWAETFLLALAAMSLTALGLSVVIISLALDKLADGTESSFPNRPTLRGAWITVINFFTIVIFSLVPLIPFYVADELGRTAYEKLIWQIMSFCLFIFLSAGIFKMSIQYRKRYRKIKSYQDKQIKSYMSVGFILTAIFLIIAGFNSIIGMGSLYLILLSAYFVGILVWVGLVTFYAQSSFDKTKKNR